MQHAGPLNAHFHQRPLKDWVLGVHQDATAANIDGTARARKTGPFGKIAETDPQVDGIAKLYPALGSNRPGGNYLPAMFSWQRENCGE